MKTKFTLFLSACAAIAFSSAAIGAEEIEIKGLGQCAKCSLKETDACLTAIVVGPTTAHKEVTYYLGKNDLAEKFHSKVCKAPCDVVAKGTVSEIDGKKILTVTRIEAVAKKD